MEKKRENWTKDCSFSYGFHRVLILRFPSALTVAWTPDPGFFIAMCLLLFEATLLLAGSA